MCFRKRLLVPLALATVVACGIALLSACAETKSDGATHAPDSLDYANMQAATELFRRGNAEAAIRKVESVLEDHPHYAEGLLMAGAMHERTDSPNEAQKRYCRAVEVLRQRVAEPEKWKLPQEPNLALALFMAGDQREAEQVMEKEQRLRPDSPTTQAIGELIRNGNREEALGTLAPKGNT